MGQCNPKNGMVTGRSDGKKTIKNYKKKDPTSPRSAAKDAKADSNPVFTETGRGAEGEASPGDVVRQASNLEIDHLMATIPNVFVTTPCQLGTEFTEKELSLIWATYSTGKGERIVSMVQMEALLSHIFDAMSEQLMEAIAFAIPPEELPPGPSREAELLRLSKNVEQLVQETRAKETAGLLTLALRALGESDGAIRQNKFMKLFNEVVKANLDTLQLDIVQHRDQESFEASSKPVPEKRQAEEPNPFAEDAPVAGQGQPGGVGSDNPFSPHHQAAEPVLKGEDEEAMPSVEDREAYLGEDESSPLSPKNIKVTESTGSV